MMRRVILSLVCSLSLSVPALAQDQTLADIRQELSVLFVEMQKLKRELSTTGGAGTTISGDTLQRVDLLESALRGLTARTEELEFRIGRIVKDGTNRVGDLEFRLCELEPGCDIGTLGETSTLGGEASTTSVSPEAAPAPVQAISDSTEFAIGEKGDFDRAKARLDAGDPDAAANLFAEFVEVYPGGPLSSQAHYFRGEALSELGQDRDAGLAFLASFSGSPSGPVAADSLLGLGFALGRLGQVQEACATLGEVGVRFPSVPAVSLAQEERARLGCS